MDELESLKEEGVRGSCPVRLLFQCEGVISARSGVVLTGNNLILQEKRLH